MAKDDQQENFEKLLSAHHGRMIDFVKFAETKNAALLTFSSVWIGSIIAMLRSDQTLPLGYDLAFKVILCLLVVAAIISLYSLLPKWLHHFHKPGDCSKNLLYFGDIATFDYGTYAARLRERYYPPEGVSYTDSYFTDLITQIWVQSRIARRKFRLFNCAAAFVLAGFSIAAIPLIVWFAQFLIAIGRAAGKI
ncbi:Pycsar system effector family protein [Azorhizobium caulinodans]|uniref:Pycsar system effector family protein n=1 Tax=Azorhizobium caulinodans TaxID=7 RepID=UPI002FBE451F